MPLPSVVWKPGGDLTYLRARFGFAYVGGCEEARVVADYAEFGIGTIMPSPGLCRVDCFEGGGFSISVLLHSA